MSTSPDRPLAISYIRFSSKKQANGASLRRQLEATQAYCERAGLQLDDSLALRDLGVSAWSGANAEHGALASFLELVKAGRVKSGTRLIVENLDRLSRRAPLDAFEVIRHILKAGITIVTLMDRQEYDADSVNGGQVFVLLGHLQRAHQESQSKSERVRDALARKKRAIVEQRKPGTANCPAWLRLSEDRSKYLPIPEKVETIRRALRMIRDGVGLESVAKTFNAEGVPPLSRRGSRWHQSYISRLVKNRQLIGEYQPHEGYGKDRKPAGEPIGGFYPAVIDKVLFVGAQQAQAKRSTKPGRTGSRVNLFSGLVVDTKGSTWVATHKGPRDKHRLVSGAARAGVPGHDYMTVPLDPFEDGLMILVRQLWERRTAPAPDGPGRVEAVLAEVADFDAKLGALRDKIKGSDAATVTMLIDLVPELEAQRAARVAEAERLQAEAMATKADLPSLMEELEYAGGGDDKARYAMRLKVRQTIREHVEKVTIYDARRQRSERVRDEGTGNQVRVPAGIWVTVELVMISGDRCLSMLFLPSKYGDLIIAPITSTTPLIGGSLPERLEVVGTHGVDVILRVGGAS